jgi:hypothetical protein
VQCAVVAAIRCLRGSPKGGVAASMSLRMTTVLRNAKWNCQLNWLFHLSGQAQEEVITLTLDITNAMWPHGNARVA